MEFLSNFLSGAAKKSTETTQTDLTVPGAVPPAKDRYFDNVLLIAKRIIVINKRAKLYYDSNLQAYTEANPNWTHPILAPFMLDSGLVALKTKDHLDSMVRFINDSHSHWDKIIGKDTSYFLTLAEELFKEVHYGVKEVKALFIERQLDGASFVTPADEAYLWSRIHALLRISLNFIEEERVKQPEAYAEIDLTKYTEFRKPSAGTTKATPTAN